MKHYIYVATLIFWSSSNFANTYHVSSSGNNNNNGLTPATAFLTLQKASDVAQPGDSVSVFPGTYTGFYHTTSGTPQQRIIFSALANVFIRQRNAITPDGINLEGASYVTIEGFEVFGMPRAGFRAVLDTGVIFRFNVADSCGKWGILTGFSENILIENNQCGRSVAEHGIYVGNSADHPIIRNNICYGNRACGIHMNADFSLQPGDGIISDALVENNVIFDNGTGGGSGINCDGVQDSRIQNNLIYNSHASGISLYKIDAAAGAKNNVVVNNTILQASDGRWALNISDGSTGNTVFNNIFYSAHSFRGSISVDAASLPGFSGNYNVHVDRLSNNGGSSNMTLAQWRTATGQDNNSVISTPAALFANVSVDDYNLSATSPAIDLGQMSFNGAAAPDDDLLSASRPQGLFPDAGALEFPVIIGWKELTEHTSVWAEIENEEMVSIYDLSGRVLITTTRQNILDGQQNLQAGLYLFRTTGEKEQSVKTGWVMVRK